MRLAGAPAANQANRVFSSYHVVLNVPPSFKWNLKHPHVLESIKLKKHSNSFGFVDLQSKILYRGGITRNYDRNSWAKAPRALPPTGPFPSSPDPFPGDEKNPEPAGDVKRWMEFSAWLFLFGSILGPPLDGLHSSVGLQNYDIGAVTIGGEPDGLHTSIWVFPLLGAMYSVVGTAQVALDRWLGHDKPPSGSWERVLASAGVLIGLLRLSAQLYADDLDYLSIGAYLLVCAQGNWLVFDRTWWGWLLALLVAVTAPLSEVVLMRYLNLWHYSQPDIFIDNEGIVSWTACCYFFYTQFVATIARAMASSVLPPASSLSLDSPSSQDED